tara:strand:- start:86947 stop:87504 length:558 start_codon:yes stop_codon:yes gene_type:complete
MRQKHGKDKILKAALKLFAENGYHRTSISQIAAAADVSKGLTYNYFDSKEELLLAIIDRASGEMSNVANEMDGEASYQETLSHFLGQYISFLKENREYLTFQLSLMFQPDLRKIVEAPLQKRANHLLNQTIVMFKKAKVRKAKLVARRFLAELDGIALHELAIFKDYPLEDMQNLLFKNYKDLQE